MNLFILLPLLLGTAGILQGGINRQLVEEVGLTHMSLITHFMAVAITVLFVIGLQLFGKQAPEIFQIRAPITTFKWWYILPAFFGFFIVLTLPYAIMKLGAVKVTVGLIAAQMVASSLWDIYVEGIPVTSIKILGMSLATASVAIISFAK